MKEKVIAISGGTSGIGLAVARILVNQGARVALGGRSNEKGMAALEELGALATFTSVDVRDEKSSFAWLDQVFSSEGRLDGLVNSAGIYWEGTIGSVTFEIYQNVMDTNLKGTFFLSQKALAIMDSQGGGQIVNVASDAGITGNLGCALYCASKSGVVGLTKALALEGALARVRVNAVCPADVETPLWQAQCALRSNPEEAALEMGQAYPMGRIARPEEVAEVICFLLSPKSSFVNGAIWTVDGGITAGI